MVRALLTVGFVAALAIVFAATGRVLKNEAPSNHEDARILARLDDFTKSGDPGVKNTIPAFVLLPGKLGVMVGEPPATAPSAGDSAQPQTVEPLSEGELQKGYCTASLPLLIRQRYPGTYDDIADADLATKVVAKHPEYRNKLCVLPAWISATPHDIVKYEMKGAASSAGSLASLAGLLWAGLVTAVCAMGLLNVYYRLLVPRLAAS